jgi:membrane associated rhomboid family serine protease
MVEVDSESRFLWKILLDIIILPFTFIMIFFGKKDFKDLFSPLRHFFEFIYQARFTFWMMIINILAFVIGFFLSDSFYEGLLLFPENVLSPMIYTILTAGFLHADLSHLFWNMLALMIFGRVVERRLGTGKTALVYFMSLIISGMIYSLINIFIFNDNTPALGASGAIMGLVSTATLLNPFYITWELSIPLPIMIVGWAAIYADISGLLSKADDGIAHYAHLGGFIAIAFIMFFLEREDRRKLLKGLIINVVSLIIFAAIYAFIVL